MKNSSMGMALLAGLLLLCSLWLSGCEEAGEPSPSVSENSSFIAETSTTFATFHYAAGTGGRIEGEADQTIRYGENGSAVTAIPAKGYLFDRWSDGLRDACRVDLSEGDLTVTACFSEAVTVRYLCEPPAAGTIEGLCEQTIAKGTSTLPVTVLPAAGYQFVGWSNGSKETTVPANDVFADCVCTAYFEEIPFIASLSISTDDGKQITNRNSYKGATLTVNAPIEAYCAENLICSVRGHGNSSWNYFQGSKPSYRLKLEDKNALLGIGEKAGKDYVLLSNHGDATMARNWIALRLSSLLEIPYTPETRFVELCVNGDYRGLYQLCEKIKTGGSRVDIDDIGEAPDTGYLLELDDRAPDGNDPWFYLPGTDIPIAVKSDAANESQLAYIRNYLGELMDAVKSGSRERVAALADIPSLTRMFLVEEFTKDRDVGFASFYLVKERGGLLYCACPWDFDLSLGNDSMFKNPTGLVTGTERENPIFAKLMKTDWFREEIRLLMQDSKPIFEQLFTETRDLFEFLADANASDDLRWDIYGRRLLFEPDKVCFNLKDYTAHCEYLLDWMEKRQAWLLDYFK